MRSSLRLPRWVWAQLVGFSIQCDSSAAVACTSRLYQAHSERQQGSLRGRLGRPKHDAAQSSASIGSSIATPATAEGNARAQADSFAEAQDAGAGGGGGGSGVLVRDQYSYSYSVPSEVGCPVRLVAATLNSRRSCKSARVRRPRRASASWPSSLRMGLAGSGIEACLTRAPPVESRARTSACPTRGSTNMQLSTCTCTCACT